MIDYPDKAVWMPARPAVVLPAPKIIRPGERLGIDIGKGMFPFPTIPPAGSAAPVTFVANNADAASATISNVPIGAAAAGRCLAIFAWLVSSKVNSGSAITNPTLTVGGNAATRLGFKSYTTWSGFGDIYSDFASGWWIINFPTGTTANFVFSGVTDAYEARVRVYSLYNLLSTTPVAFTNPALQVGVSSVALNTNVVKDGIVLGGTTWSDEAFAVGVGSFSGLTTDFQYESAADYDVLWTGYHLPTAAESPRAISTTRGQMNTGSTSAFVLSLR